MKTYEVTFGEYTNIYISEQDHAEGIILKFVGDKPNPAVRDHKHIRVYLEQPKHPEKKDNRVPVIPTIPGHPNCHYGDCLGDCHVVSCGIYQGFEEIPVLPENYEYEYVDVEEKTEE